METITIILGIVMLVFGILQIILFFKVWGMTDDVKYMRKMAQHIYDKKTINNDDCHKKVTTYEEPQNKESTPYATEISHIYKVADVVYHKPSNMTMRLHENCGNGIWRCVTDAGDECYCSYAEFESIP